MGFLYLQQVRQCPTASDSDFYNYQNLNSRRLNCGTLIDRITIWCAKWDTDVVHGVPIGITVGSGTNFFCKYSCGIKNLPINVVRGRKRTGYVRDWAFPNITGGFCAGQGLYKNTYGAFSRGERIIGGGVNTYPQNGCYPFDFSAANSSSIYQDSKVQPAALQALIIIKIWQARGCTVADLE